MRTKYVDMVVQIGDVFYTFVLHKRKLKRLLKIKYFINCINLRQNKIIQVYWICSIEKLNA